MQDEIRRVLKLVEDNKLTGDQAAEMIELLRAGAAEGAAEGERGERHESARPPGEARRDERREGGPRHGERRGRGYGRRGHRPHGQRRRHGAAAGAFGAIFDTLGDDIRRVVEDAVQGVFGGEGWTDDANSAMFAKVEEPTGEDFVMERNRVVVSQLDRLRLDHAELCGNELQASALSDVALRHSSFNDNVMRGSSVKRAELDGAEMHRNRLHGAALAGVELGSAKFVDNDMQGARIRQLRLADSTLRGSAMSGTKLKNLVLSSQAEWQNVKLRGVAGSDWLFDASQCRGLRIKGMNVNGLSVVRSELLDCAFGRGRREEDADRRPAISDLSLERVSLKDCRFVRCRFDGTTIRDVRAEGLRFEGVDFTGLTISSSEELRALALDDAA